LVLIVVRHLRKVGSSNAVATNIADINVVAENVAKEWSLPVSKGVANFSSCCEIHAAATIKGEPIIMNLYETNYGFKLKV